MKPATNQNAVSSKKRKVSLAPLGKDKVVGLRYAKAPSQKDIVDIQDLEKSLQLIMDAYYSDDTKLVRIRKKTLRDMVMQNILHSAKKFSSKHTYKQFK